MQVGSLRRLPVAAGIVLATFGLSGCHHDSPTPTSSSSPTSPASSPTTEQSAAADGACAGGTTDKGGGDRLQISFVVSQDGSTICNLRGEVEIACASMSAANDSLLPYSDSNAISVDSDGSFSDQYALGSGSLTVNGTVDDEKSAHGTFEFHETSCTSGTIPWQVPYTGSPTSTTQPGASSSCNNPCGSFGGVTVEVTGVDGGTVTSSTSGSTGEAALIVTATVSND
ncbi:MAG TPA: hypothetical protein VFH70_11775, partial [Acidimicrobiales bacterium]|nr:hypothetical protein [Acidimicrobiales bacterium]